MVRLRGSFYAVVALASASAAFAVPAARPVNGVSAVTPGEVSFFKDWAVGCDNALSCEAVSLMPEQDITDDLISLVIARSAGRSDALRITLDGFESATETYRLLVDGRILSSGKITGDRATIIIDGNAARGVIRAMAVGKTLKLLEGDGAILGVASLAGSAAALREIDLRQGRAGAVDALIARGRKAAMTKIPSTPVVTAKRIVPDSNIPDTASLIALAERGECAAERSGVTENATYSLGKLNGLPRALAVIGCGSGAYNTASTAYIGTQNETGKWSFAPAQFDYVKSAKNEATGTVFLNNVAWNPDAQSLSTVAKTRGIGDCGTARTYVWDGAVFRLTEAVAMEECRGSIDWITIWRAKVELVA